MKKLLLSVITVIACSGLASAQSVYAGPALAGLRLPVGQSGFGVTLLSLGGQVGVNNLAGPLGVRATVDFALSPISGPIILAGDVLLSSSGNTTFYGGAGFGIFTAGGATAPIARAIAGAEFGVSEGIGIFVEATPLYALETGNFFIGGRAGVNFAFSEF